jgi:hypothetical protein
MEYETADVQEKTMRRRAAEIRLVLMAKGLRGPALDQETAKALCARMGINLEQSFRPAPARPQPTAKELADKAEKERLARVDAAYREARRNQPAFDEECARHGIS